MKRKIFAILVVLVVAGLVLFLFRPKTRGTAPDIRETKDAAAKIEKGATSGHLDPNGLQTPYDMKRRSAGTPSVLTSWMAEYDKKVQKAIERDMGLNKPVVFHGRVLDQDDEGIPGVEVQLKTSRMYKDPGGGRYGQDRFDFSVETGGDGKFSVEGFNAIDIDVYNLVKKDYIQSPHVRQKHSTQRGAWGSRENPVVFRMWRSQGAEPILPASGFARLASDGTPETVDLLAGGSRSVTDPVIFSVLRDDAAATKEQGEYGAKFKYDWRFEVEVPGGGIILVDAEQAYFAPEKGYERKAVYEVRKDSKDWSAEKELKAYIVTGNPNRYSRASLTIATFDGERDGKLEPTIRLNYEFHTNPSGSRNLEYDPEKDVRLMEFYKNQESK